MGFAAYSGIHLFVDTVPFMTRRKRCCNKAASQGCVHLILGRFSASELPNEESTHGEFYLGQSLNRRCIQRSSIDAKLRSMTGTVPGHLE